jgi:hypothetical protein
MSYLAESAVNAPQDPNGRPYAWHRRVAALEANDAVALEAAINNYLASLRTAYEYVALIDITLVSPANNKTLALISYGWFEREVY